MSGERTEENVCVVRVIVDGERQWEEEKEKDKEREKKGKQNKKKQKKEKLSGEESNR